MRRAIVGAAVVALLASLAGCATQPPPAPAARRPPPAAPPAAGAGAEGGRQVGTTASGGAITVHEPPAPVPAVVDSAPSQEALAVLRTIPEPLGGEAAPDTAAVPVPAPTLPLGDRGSRATATLPDSAPPPPAAPPASSPPAARASAPPSPAASDSCWRVQVLAPPERDRAERMAELARSLLLVPFVVEKEAGLYKVRTRDCLTALAAQDLRNRALASGLAGAFRFPRPRP